MDKEARGQESILFNNQEIDMADTLTALNKFFEEKNLGEEKEVELGAWFQTEIQRMIKRKQMLDGKKPSREYINAALNHVLAKLEMLTQYTLTAKERNEERLNPFLLTKAGLRKEMDAALSQTRETKDDKKPVLVLVNIDLDDFKIINDKEGHGVGDAVLKSVGKALGASIRPNDFGAHYSGDEFGILLPMSFPQDMKDKEIEEKIEEILGRIVDKMQTQIKRPDGKTQELSAGYRIITKKDRGDFEDFHKDADTAAELSKVIRIIEEGKGKHVNSAERILSFSAVQEIMEKYAKGDMAKATAIRHMKRYLYELYPDMSAKFLREELEKFIRGIELSATN